MNDPINEQYLTQQAEQLAAVLINGQLTLGTAESCTGGWIAQACTDLAGSSRWFQGGIVSYSNTAKMRVLNVPAALIDEHGAVSQPVAEAMVKGAVAALECNIAVAVTGVAGPGGGSAAKPVGTVWIAWGDGLHIASERFQFDGDRRSVRAQTVAMALQRVREYTQRRDRIAP